jgi:predicted KAP-like P-loop ATPase
MADTIQTREFFADRPIRTLGEDLLGRAKFAESLADAIRGWKDKASLVIGLYGPWGSGKSSVKNMTVDALRRSGAEGPTVCEFNPWRWAGQEKVLEAFFEEISVALGRADQGPQSRRRVAKLRQYAHVLRAGEHLLSGVQGFVTWVFLVASALGVGAVATDNTLLRVTGGVLFLICLGLIAFAKWGGTWFEYVADILNSRLEDEDRGLEQRKLDLSNELATLKKPVLMVIDDIDRLEKDQIQLVMQLVKANADFPNIVYLLIFQRDIVEANLTSEGMEGREFLDKVVQVPFDLPQTEQVKLEKVLLGSLNRVLNTQPEMWKRFDRHRWENLYLGGLRPYFQTLRGVYRYLNTLSFNAALLKGSQAFEVNPIDLIAVEVLRVFEPRVHSQIARSGDVLTKVVRHDIEREPGRATVSGLMAAASEDHKEYVKEIIQDLFPNMRWAFNGPHYGSDSADEWYRELRVCHPEVFARYFQLSIAEGDISQSELDEILDRSGDRDALVAIFRRLLHRRLLDVAVDRLEAYKQQIPIANARSFVTAILDVADELPHEARGFLELGPHMHATRVVSWCLRQETDVEKRGEILLHAAATTEGLSVLASLVHMDDRRYSVGRDVEFALGTREQVGELKRLVAEKIRAAAEHDPNRFVLNEHLPELLFFWQSFGATDAAKAWVNELTRDEHRLLQVLAGFVGRTKSIGMGDRTYQADETINLENLGSFLDVDAVKERLAALDRQKLDATEKRVIDAFDKALAEKKERPGRQAG